MALRRPALRKAVALAAGGFYRTPGGHWTNTPIVTGDGFGFS